MCSPEIAQPQSRCEETTHRTYRAFEDAACEAFASEAASEAICDLPVLWHRFRSTTPSPRRLSEPLRRLTARTVCACCAPLARALRRCALCGPLALAAPRPKRVFAFSAERGCRRG